MEKELREILLRTKATPELTIKPQSNKIIMSTHIDANGNVIMVDVSPKTPSTREATAQGRIYMSPEALEATVKRKAKKGDVLTVAQIAGIMGAKKTPELIPLCHPIAMDSCRVDFTVEEKGLLASCTAISCGKTGIEMEALTGVTIALLTVYDMLKGLDRSMEITEICLLEKTGGKSGTYIRKG